ncbi:gulonolactone oxidase Lgo1 [Infundibulicybe gibba]|nr:gulonolactone oxidase Lgo1 [Infundibulicybe gibba]
MSSVVSTIPLQNLYGLLQPVTIPPHSPRAKFSNWGQTFHCTPLAVFEPETELQCSLILELARREGKVVRAVGVGHSPSDLACTNEFMLRTTKLNRVLEVNTEKRYVVAQAGITLHDLHAELAKHNLAMMNVVMSTHAIALTLLLADGSRVSCSRNERPDLFIASICGLGCTGLILSIQLEVEPAFRLKEVQESLPFEDVIENLDELAYSAEHVRFWWFPTADIVRASYSDRTQEPKKPAGNWWWHTLMGYHAIQLLLFIGRFLPPLNTWVANFACWLVSNKSVGIDDSHVIFNVDCRYPQHTTEWAIPYRNSQACLRELQAWLEQERLDPHGLRPHFPIELRFSAADDIWLSPSNGQRTCWIGIVQYKPYGFNVPYRKLFDGFERIMTRHQGRPHWAKAHQLRPNTLRKLYPRFGDFVQVLQEVDPRGMFRNEYVQRHILGRPVGGRVFKTRQT